MSDLERVAEAANRYFVRMWGSPVDYAICDGTIAWDSEPVLKGKPEQELRAECRLMNARAAITALMAPSEGMLEAGARQNAMIDGNVLGLKFAPFQSAYIAMLRHVLDQPTAART